MRETVHSLLPQIYPRIYQHSNNEKRKPIINQIHFPFRARSRSPQLPPLHPPTFEPTIQKKRKKLITYLQTVTRIQNPRSSYFSFHSRICTGAPSRIVDHHRHRFNHRRNSLDPTSSVHEGDPSVPFFLSLSPKYQRAPPV